MNGNTTEQKTLEPFLDKIEQAYGKARRVRWVRDRGIPTETTLKMMGEPERQTRYLVRTPNRRTKQQEQKWLDLPWQKARDSVEVKRYEHEEELYVLAPSDGRQARKNAMRRSLPERDQLSLRIGAAKKVAGRAFGFLEIDLPLGQQAVTRETFRFRVNRAKLRQAEQRDGHYLLRTNLTGVNGHVKTSKSEHQADTTAVHVGIALESRYQMGYASNSRGRR